ncbi:TonB-dependent receptor [Erwinia psidii]|nr:TonB-dependent receptor [Erwinia psidii]
MGGLSSPEPVQVWREDNGNRNFKPEKSRQYGGGLTGLVSWRLSAYRNDIADLIDSGLTTFCYHNINKATIKGMEAPVAFATARLAIPFLMATLPLMVLTK